jgi:hypothetical protein
MVQAAAARRAVPHQPKPGYLGGASARQRGRGSVGGGGTRVSRGCWGPAGSRLRAEGGGERRAVSGGHAEGPRIRGLGRVGYRLGPPATRVAGRHRPGGGLRDGRARSALRARCTRMRVMTAGSVMTATMRIGAAHRGPARGSTS